MAVIYFTRLAVVAVAVALIEAMSGSMCVAQVPSYDQLANTASWREFPWMATGDLLTKHGISCWPTD